MKIDFHDYGAVANIIVTSTIFEFRRHNRIVSTVMFYTPDLRANRKGTLLMKTVISGRVKTMLRAYKTALREAAR